MTESQRAYKDMSDEQLAQIARSKLALAAQLFDELERRGWNVHCGRCGIEYKDEQFLAIRKLMKL